MDFLSNFHEYFKYVKTVNVQCDNNFLLVACLPTTHLALIKHNCISHKLYTLSKRRLLTTVVIGYPERHMRKASHRGSKQ